MKVIISESEKKSILKMYGLLNEQSSFQISIEGTQPVDNTDWDLVHGILGSSRLDDDLERRVSDKLKTGNYMVEDVKISSAKQGNEIKTKGVAYLRGVKQGETPHKFFTTRGSIGGSYSQRHDNQINGLVDKLKNYYKGNVIMFGPYEINVVGTGVNFRQSFFAIDGGSSQSTQSQQPITITGTTEEDFRQKIKDGTKGVSIDETNIVIDADNFKLILNPGKTKIQGMTFIIDNISEDTLNKRFKDNIKYNNPTAVVEKSGKNKNGYWWNLVIFK